MRKYLLWDFDNTLAYRDGMWTETLYQLLKRNGITTISREKIKLYMQYGYPWSTPEIPHEELFKGRSWWTFMNAHIQMVLQSVGLDESLASQLASQFKDDYLEKSRWFLYEDTLPALKKAIAGGYQNIIVSNHVPELNDLVVSLGLAPYFRNVFSSALVGYDKPNKGFYLHVLSHIENTSDVTMIGDNYEADVLGALAVGIKAIIVRKENEHNYKQYSESLMGIFDYL